MWILPRHFSAAGFDINDSRFDYLDGRELSLTALGKVEPRDYVLGATTVVCGPRAYLRGKDFAFSMRVRQTNASPSAKFAPNTNIKWALNCPSEEAEMALFDLRVDSKERNNVAYTKEYKELAEWFRKKLANIVLGDNRVESVWQEKNVYNISQFAVGSDDKKLDIPDRLIPKVN